MYFISTAFHIFLQISKLWNHFIDSYIYIFFCKRMPYQYHNEILQKQLNNSVRHVFCLFLSSFNGTNRMFYKLFVCEWWVFTKVRYNRIKCVASAMRAYRQLEENKSFRMFECIDPGRFDFHRTKSELNIRNRFEKRKRKKYPNSCSEH